MLAIKYSLFAILSIIFNVITQLLCLYIYTGVGKLYVAMLAGTLVGLVSKYVLDKKYIFYYISKNRSEKFREFIMYSFFGVFTTLIFWVTEISFDRFFEYEEAKFLGAVIGLGIGYYIKYHLDKKYVFNV